jgi:hypothetical protein
VLSSIAGLLRLASIVICLIVVASFAIFAFDQVSGASAHQQQEVNGGSAKTANSGAPASLGSPSPHEGALHEAIDEASNALTSPFSGIAAGSGEWAVRGVDVLLALVIYGFGFGFVARVLRVRV